MARHPTTNESGDDTMSRQRGINHGTNGVSKASHWQDMMNRDGREVKKRWKRMQGKMEILMMLKAMNGGKRKIQGTV